MKVDSKITGLYYGVIFSGAVAEMTPMRYNHQNGYLYMKVVLDDSIALNSGGQKRSTIHFIVQEDTLVGDFCSIYKPQPKNG